MTYADGFDPQMEAASTIESLPLSVLWQTLTEPREEGRKAIPVIEMPLMVVVIGYVGG